MKWGDDLPTAAQLAAEYGPDAARLSLTTLQGRLQTEHLTIGDFLTAVPDDATAYNLDSRVKYGPADGRCSPRCTPTPQAADTRVCTRIC